MEAVDFVIVGAGLSGIAAARGLLSDDPGRSVAILESRDASGGTWDLFRYPGIRSDSDMTTFGYRDRPWTDPRSIAPGSAILDYLRSAADDAGVTDLMRFQHRVTRAEWSSESARWTIDYVRGDARETSRISCLFLLLCTGYYRYDEGFRPEWPGLETYAGTLVHPQHWPDGLDYAGRRFVVVGSGATAVTLLPALAERGAQVTMLQRSPGYIASLPAVNEKALRNRRRLPAPVAEWVNRWSSIARGVAIYAYSKRRPTAMRSLLRRGVESRLPEGYDVDRHFSPAYDPWDQRLCVAPDGDFFTAIRSGMARVVTDRIDTFTPSGVSLASGEELEADVVVTATGLNLLLFGDIEIVVDGAVVDPSTTVAYRGMMLSGVPNLVFTIGYTNASWTLKIDLIVKHLLRIVAQLERGGHDSVVARSPEDARTLPPLIDLAAGYVKRGAGEMPRQSARSSWRVHQNYFADTLLFRRPVRDGLEFATASHVAAETRSQAGVS